MVSIIVYGREDVKKSGGFKKKNNSILFHEKEDFFNYLEKNKLTIESNYIDITGNISNGKRFSCEYNGLVIGTSKIVEEFNKVDPSGFTKEENKKLKEKYKDMTF